MRRTAVALLALPLALGCGTTRTTDTLRTGTEQLLISNAIDQAVAQIDFHCLAGKPVFLDAQYLDATTVDKGYLVSSIRQCLLATGCTLLEDKTKATYVVELRTGGIGTDRHSLLVGIPQMNIPTFVPGQPSQIPEIPFAKTTDEYGVAKVAVFAYNRATGQRVWQSGAVEAVSTAKDTWVAGLGPFRAGTILKGTEFAGRELALAGHGEPGEHRHARASVPPTDPAIWPETAVAKDLFSPVLDTLANATLGLVRFRPAEKKDAAAAEAKLVQKKPDKLSPDAQADAEPAKTRRGTAGMPAGG